MVAEELKVSSVDDWNADKHGVVNGPIEEEVEDGECVELASDKYSSHLDEQQEVTYKRRKTMRQKIAKTTSSNKLVGSETFHNIKKVKINSQASGQIVKRRNQEAPTP